jgi:predicted negative regulator of RcsB-dependent stress response
LAATIRAMKPTLTAAATALAKQARAEGVLALVILADETTPAIEVLSLARMQAQREALERAIKLLTPRKSAN